MSTENIDDLFRRQLGDHATPPADDLWARLQAGPGAAAPGPAPAPEAAHATPERVDEFYKERLKTHVTRPSREVWERLEDEHLRPRKRRPAAWWPMAMAAAVALLLLAGGAGLWLGFPGSGGRGATGTVATQSGSGSRPSDSNQRAAGKPEMPATGSNGPAERPGATAADLAANTAQPGTNAAGATAGAGAAATMPSIAQNSETSISGRQQKNLPARATRPTGSASSASKAGMMAQQSPRRPQGASRPLDAVAANPAPLVARTTAPSTTSTKPADEPAPALAANTLPTATTPAGGIAPAATPASLAAASLITVDVRSGAARRPSLGTAVATAAATAAEERRGLGGRLLRQVGHAVRGERISLSEVTGLPENLTLEANIAGRRVSKSIQL